MGKLREKIAKADEKLQLNEEAFRPSGWVVAVVLIFLIAAMSTSIFLFEQHLHITMLICMGFTILLLVLDGCSYSKIEKAMLHGGLLVIPTLLVLFCIGALMGSWIASGTVPMIIYWGLKLINPAAFLATACIACMITSLATGSSWSTVGTVGVALMGVGLGLNINPAMTAGAVVSGAVFGDKMSPMSDTTNVAPAVAEADIFDHIKAMMFTGGPAIVIALIIYVIMGINHQGDVDSATIDAITSALKTGFHLNAWTLVPIVVVFVLAIKKVPAFPTLLISGLLAAVIALFAQGSGFVNILSVMENGFVSETGIAEIDKLLSRGGIFSMNYNVTLSVIVMVYGGLLEKCGILAVFLDKIKGLTKTVGTLVLTTVITEIALNLLTASQYLTIVLGGRLLIPCYKEKDMLPQTLSRTLEDSGTVTSMLIPWNLCGAFATAALGVNSFVYLPYAFFNLLTPVIAILWGFLGKFQWKTGEIPSKRTYRDVQEDEKPAEA